MRRVSFDAQGFTGGVSFKVYENEDELIAKGMMWPNSPQNGVVFHACDFPADGKGGKRESLVNWLHDQATRWQKGNKL